MVLCNILPVRTVGSENRQLRLRSGVARGGEVAEHHGVVVGDCR